MVHCPLSGCYLLRDIISQGQKTIMANLSSVHRLRDINFVFVSLWIPILCFWHWFFPPLFLMYDGHFLVLLFCSRVWGSRISHIRSFIQSRKRQTYVYTFFYVHSCHWKLIIIFLSLWNAKSNFKIRTTQFTW